LISIIASASRISILAIGFAIAILGLAKITKGQSELRSNKKNNSGLIRSIYIVFVIFMIAIGSAASANFGHILARYESRVQTTESNSLTLRESYNLAKSEPSIKTSKQYSEIVFLNAPDFTGGFESSDASTRRRYFVWFFLLNTFVASKSFIFGLGPGFAGSAVDGNYVRIVAEYGIVGVVSYWRWFSNLLRDSTIWFKASVVSVLITGLYIDIFTSIKTCLLIYIFWLISKREKTAPL
jgi:hypothetical protein